MCLTIIDFYSMQTLRNFQREKCAKHFENESWSFTLIMNLCNSDLMQS